MASTNSPANSPFTLALEAIGNLWNEAFARLELSGQFTSFMAHGKIRRTPLADKTGPFYGHLVPWRNELAALLADTYRRYFKLALAHPQLARGHPHEWAWSQIRPAIGVVLESIIDWYILACDGENQRVRPVGTMELPPGQTTSLSIPVTVEPYPPSNSWRAPAWLFAISMVDVGIGPLKQKHVPATNSEEKLGAAHTRLLLGGARRVFLWQLGTAIETVRNQEVAAAGAIPADTANEQTKEAKKRKGSEPPKGTEGLVRKADLSQYMHNLTERQQLAFSLKYEYELGLEEIASREFARSNEKRKAGRSEDASD
jgi:hypothetical protein